MSSDSSSLIKVGRITTVFGVKGWVKVHSDTEPVDNILKYQPWYLKLDNQWQKVELSEGKKHSKGLVAHIKGCDDRDEALRYRQVDIAIQTDLLAELGDNDFYWHQLEGLAVETTVGVKLGKVDHLIETGSNDVLVVKATEGSLDKQERLIPYLDHVIEKIDLDAGLIRVDWDPEF